MKVGVFTPLLSQLPLPAVLDKLKALHIDTVEFGTGNYPGDAHCKLSMLDDPKALAEFQKLLADRGISISALSCHGNALHPDPVRATHDRDVSRKTVLLAEKLGVPVVVDFSGCPGDSPQSTAPNWVTCPWPPDYLEVLAWQWDQVVTPYWSEHGKFAADHGVRIAIEMHPGFVAYSPGNDAQAPRHRRSRRRRQSRPQSSLLAEHRPYRCRACARPRHLLRPCQRHAALSREPPATGVLDTKPYTDERNRGWIFRTCGYGHGAEWWKEFVSTLRMFGYDNVLSIEHEDSLLSAEEGLTNAAAFLNDLVIREQPGAAWWV